MRNSLGGDASEKGRGLPKPRSFPAAKISGHGGFLVKYLSRPLAGFGTAALRLQEEGVVVIGLRASGDVGGVAKKLIGLISPSGFRIGMGEEAFGAVEVITRIRSDHTLQVGDGRAKVSEFDFGNAPAIEGVW
jgi:hypothetical protein